MAPTILSVFGSKEQIDDIVRQFDFSKINVRDSSKHDYLTTGLVPSFGKLNRDSIKQMDEKLKVAIAATNRALAELPSQQRSWDNLISVMMRNHVIEPMGDGIHRSDSLTKKGTNVFKFDGSPDSSVVREVRTWFVQLIGDADVLDSTQIDINVLGQIVAQTGATIDSFESFFAKNEYHNKTMVDIGVLRYPDIDHPYFKVYRIKLNAWSESRRILFVQDDTNGINGEFVARMFKPRDSFINEMRQDVLKQAIKEAEDMFN